MCGHQIQKEDQSRLLETFREAEAEKRGNISDILDDEFRFDESGTPIQLLCRPYSGLAVTEVRARICFYHNIIIILLFFIGSGPLIYFSESKSQVVVASYLCRNK